MLNLKTAPSLAVAMGLFIAPSAAFGKAMPNPVANSGIHAKKVTHMIHPMPVPNSKRTSST